MKETENFNFSRRKKFCVENSCNLIPIQKYLSRLFRIIEICNPISPLEKEKKNTQKTFKK